MSVQEIWDEFRATKCAVCDDRKGQQRSFCRRCYYALPAAMRQALWRLFGEGYEAAYEAAKSWLQAKKEKVDAA